jgi:hypothetical protein
MSAPMKAMRPRVLNIRDLPGFKERKPIIPARALYIGRANRRYGLPASKWCNHFQIKQNEGVSRERVIAVYAQWLRVTPGLMVTLDELTGVDLICWCAPEACHGDVLLRLANDPAGTWCG